MAEKAKVFIASSGKQRDVVNDLVILLDDAFEVAPWTDAFPPGELTMQVLVDARDRYDCAICIFGKDDILDDVEMPAAPQSSEPQAGTPITRDNVILEFGLFLGALGPERVLIVAEKGVKIPTDLAALTVMSFDSGSPAKKSAQLNQLAAKVRKVWTDLPLPSPPALPPPQDHGLGFKETIVEIERRLAEIRKNLHRSGSKRLAVAAAPVKFDLTDECISTYAEALNRTSKRFWVTTYWRSGFWSSPSDDVVDANQRLSARLRGPDSLRRIFMLANPLDQEIDRLRDECAFLRRMKRHDDIKKMRDEFDGQRKSINRQQQQGFEVRVAYDEAAVASQIPEAVQFKRLDTEVVTSTPFE